MPAEIMVRPEVGRIAADDAVVVVREALGFHERLLAALRAADKVREPRARAVEGLGDRLALQGHLVRCSIREIDDQLGVAESPDSVRIGDLVAGIGAGCGEFRLSAVAIAP